LVAFHVSTAAVSLLSGFLAMGLRKGSGWHAAAGNIFVVSMLCMSSSAAFMAAFMKPVAVNVLAGLLTFYLTATAWWAARRRDGATGIFDAAALLFILAVGAGGMMVGLAAANSPTGRIHQAPAAAYFVFASLALLCAVSDVRMLMRGGVVGAKRIARHLWRISFALLIATLSFYPGQAKLFPKSVRASSLMYLPHMFLVGSMLYWIYRVSIRRRIAIRARQHDTAGIGTLETIARAR